MKKIVICILFALFAFSNTLTAQRYDEDVYIAYLKNEFYVQYGFPSIVELTNKLENDTYTSPQHTKKYKGVDTRYSGIAAVGYNRYLNPYFCIGGYFGISEASIKAQDTQTQRIVFTNDVRSYTGMVNLGWTYYRNGIWEVSCGVAAGVAYKDENQRKADNSSDLIPDEDDRLALAYNLTAMRVRIGGGIVGGFAELGFGYKGIFNAGVSIKF